MSLKAISLKHKNTIIRCSYMFHYYYSFTHSHTLNDIPCDCHGRKILWISRSREGITFNVFDIAFKTASSWDSIQNEYYISNYIHIKVYRKINTLLFFANINGHHQMVQNDQLFQPATTSTNVHSRIILLHVLIH